MTIHVGLVGYGLAGAVFHAPLIESVEGLTLSSIVTSQSEKVKRDYPHVVVVPTLERLLEDDNIALVVIATPNETHLEFARKALEAGKHVVVEKPFVIHTAQADELIDLAHGRNVVLSVFQNRRWDNDFGVITFFRTIFPAKPAQSKDGPESSPLSRKDSLPVPSEAVSLTVLTSS